MRKFTKYIFHPRFLLGLYLALAIFTGIQQYVKTQQVDERYTRYNNYVIFKQSYAHLMAGENLYQAYPEEYWDLYKYTPTFAVFFGIFALLPDPLGLVLWSLVNVMVLFFAIRSLPNLSDRSRAFILLYICVELATSIQNLQTNALLTGLIILGFSHLEKRSYLKATLFIILSAFIKVFGIFAIVLYLFYPKKYSLLAYSVLWGLVLFFLPVILVGFSGLIQQYQEWLALLWDDQSKNIGFSVSTWLYSWYGIAAPKMLVALAGLAIFAIPLIRIDAYQQYQFRLMTLASILIWLVIFNHMAESPTFIIAVTGVAVWFSARKRDTAGIVLLVLVFLLSCLSLTDLVPREFRTAIVIPYAIKAAPCIFVWLLLVLEMSIDRMRGVRG